MDTKLTTRNEPGYDNHHRDWFHKSHKYDFATSIDQQILSVKSMLSLVKTQIKQLEAKYLRIPFFRVFKRSRIEYYIVALSIKFHEYEDELKWLTKEIEISNARSEYNCHQVNRISEASPQLHQSFSDEVAEYTRFCIVVVAAEIFLPTNDSLYKANPIVKESHNDVCLDTFSSWLNL